MKENKIIISENDLVDILNRKNLTTDDDNELMAMKINKKFNYKDDDNDSNNDNKIKESEYLDDLITLFSILNILKTKRNESGSLMKINATPKSLDYNNLNEENLNSYFEDVETSNPYKTNVSKDNIGEILEELYVLINKITTNYLVNSMINLSKNSNTDFNNYSQSINKFIFLKHDSVLSNKYKNIRHSLNKSNVKIDYSEPIFLVKSLKKIITNKKQLGLYYVSILLLVYNVYS